MCLQELVGRASRYERAYLSPAERDKLLALCDRQKYSVYEFAYRNDFRQGTTKVKRAPKAEFYLPNAEGKRPLYRWGQTKEFHQAGHEMPPALRALAARIAAETGELVNHCIIIDYEDGYSQFAPPHKDKAQGVAVPPGTPLDMARGGSFFVLSLGTEREFTLQRTRDAPPHPWDVVWRQPLASGSLLTVAACDNRELYHAVHQQPGKGGRYSIIFRTIDTHIDVDAERAAVANGDAHRFAKKRKRASSVSLRAWLSVKA